jgi:5-methylcytosine-specific restriction endonuclease McrA
VATRRALVALKPRALASLPPKAQPPRTTERLFGSAGAAMREAIRKRDSYLCQACKREGSTRAGHHVDHIKPLEEGGTNALENQELLCKAHHDAKSAEENRRRNTQAPRTSR